MPGRRLLAVLAFVLGCAIAAPSAHAAGDGSLVALGDSYSSGEGNPLFEPGTANAHDSCHRSRHAAWPKLLAGDFRLPVVSFACSGAVASEIVQDDPDEDEPERQVAQIARLAGRSPSLVTLSVGGNDAGFGRVLATCIKRSDCRKTFMKGGVDTIDRDIDHLARRLPGIYAEVLAATPSARLVVVDYPRIFSRNRRKINCAALINALTPREAAYLNRKAAHLDAVIRRAAVGPRITFVDVADAFAGHEISCRPGGWVHRLRVIRAFSFHPKPRGQRALADVIGARLRTLGVLPLT
jgi:lysophospholipase L1-like esterase